MADTKTNQTRTPAEERSMAPRDREPRGMRRWDPSAGALGSSFEFFDRMSEEMDRLFDRIWRDVGFGRRRGMSRMSGGAGGRGIWTPSVESFQKGDRFIVRAELPGVNKDNVDVELTEDALTIRGERREEHEEEREGYYHTEREYGQFYRTIPLPEGVITDSAQATFRDGVLEVTMQAPPAEATRGRRLEIHEESETGKK